MNSTNKKPEFDSNHLSQSDISSSVNEKVWIVRGSDRRRKERAVIDEEIATLNREQLVATRENALNLREREILEAEATLSAANEHQLVLEQVNGRLVTATIEAQKLVEQVQIAKDQMESAKSVAQKANRAKSEFLSCMSHELRTPLNAILGFAQLLEIGKPPLTTTQMLRLQEIIKAGWYLLKLVNEILDLALIESGKLSLSLETSSIQDILQESVTMIQPQAQQHGVQLHLWPFDNIGKVYTDHTRMKQVLLNLLSNAVKYNRAQGTVDIICSMSSPKTLRISVKDSGAGLPAEKLTQLFQPFNRLGQEHGNEEGTGIGLMMSKQLIELMNGKIGVESTVGVGSVFWIELPVEVIPPSAVTDSLPFTAFSSPVAGELTPRTLLYMEDNPANLMLVEQIITEYQHLNFMSAHHGYQGVALARAHHPDVILMDINLPGISGSHALEILSEDPATAHIPVIALSANAMPRDIEKGLQAGFFAYLTKPIKVYELLNTLNNALNRHP